MPEEMSDQITPPLGGDYPSDWGGFVGQEGAKRQLRVMAAAAGRRGCPMEPVLLASATAGIGKTSLALLVAGEIGRAAGRATQLKVDSGAIRVDQARIILGALNDGDVWFVDEAHRLADGGAKNADWMLHLLADGVIFGPLGPEPAPKITVIAATTDAGKLPGPLLDRFVVRPTLTSYSDQEGRAIAMKLSERMLAPDGLPPVDAATATKLARAAGNRPRAIAKLLANLRALAVADETDHDPSGRYDVTEALAWAGLDEDGLSAAGRGYLQLLAGPLAGRPAGKDQLAERLGLVGSELTDLERSLMEAGLVERTQRGRVLTRDGIVRARRSAA